MVRRRGVVRAVGAAAVGGLAATSGCLDALTGSEPTEISAEPATVPEAALDETGYAEYRVEPMEIERTFEMAGQSRTVVVRNQLAQYDKAVEFAGQRYRAAVFTVLSTPAVEFAGRTFNPVGGMSTADLARRMLGRYEGVTGVRQLDDGTAQVLGTETTVGVFEAETELTEGVTVDTRIHVANAVRAGADFVVPVGAYPALLSGEADAVRTLMGAVEHAGD